MIGLHKEEPLVVIKFSESYVSYTHDFRVQVEGFLWPREFSAAQKMIELYKEQSKITKEKGGNKQ